MSTEFADLQLEGDRFYEIRNPQEPDWFVIARFSHVEVAAAFGNVPPQPLAEVSAENVADGTTVTEVPDLGAALEADTAYRVVYRNGSERIATYQGPGLAGVIGEVGFEGLPPREIDVSPTLLFSDPAAFSVIVNQVAGVTSPNP